MSFQNNIFWLPNGSGSVANGEICYETSTRIDQKRPHQYFMDSSEQELVVSKKQAVEPFKGTSGPVVMESSFWHDGSHFQSESLIPSLFTPKPVQSSNFSDNNNPPVTASMNMERKEPGNQFGNDSSVCLTMSHAVNDTLCLNSGPRKVKVNEVRIPENCLPEFVGSTFTRGEKNDAMTSTFQRTSNNMFTRPSYNTELGNAISVDPAYSKLDKNFVSVGNSSSKRDGNFILSSQYYNGIDNNVLSIGQAFNRGNYNINALGEQYEKENGNFSSVCPTYNGGQENLFALEPFYSKVNETFISAGPNKGETHIAFQGEQDATVALGALYNKENSSILSMVEHSRKGEETTISFGGFQNNVEERDNSGRLISSYDVLLNQSSAQSSGALGQKDSTDQLSDNAISASSLQPDGAPKNKDQKTKKGSSNNFPSNVKSLLSTGILDGVPVKYVSWSREKNLRGVVKGTGYLCSCQDCKLSKTINAYEFERHADCKTKHPNNHIYFENGKTIYAVVQELKSTPQEMLFDVIQNVTGSAVNMKNFNIWKASYQAATRELQRIYGKDDLIVPS
ncbi:uncharacterized protein LOC121769063 [Salvia splendens]|uniref:uncharacterized protein LOC121769063 n=1 Tax=Salvia splendens TaxID=180675 RepID=UPI001C278EA0|nr:uncharacterized protein LOC121769063 [Salvia splendens]XP_042021667.1 uncharacterized protein LOC121769063 [Salvia splendens]